MTARREPPMPGKVKVGPLTYAITRDSLNFTLAEHKTRSNLYGSCDHKQQQIHLDPDMAPGQTRSTLLHEVLHALFTVSGVNLSDDKEERAVRALEAPLLALLRDNPVLVAFLAGGTT